MRWLWKNLESSSYLLELNDLNLYLYLNLTVALEL